MFSIIIPLYNKEDCITETLQTALDQTFENFEVIVVDDGSSDGSLRIVQEFNDPRIKVFSKTNGGVSEARNYGILKAKNKYIAFLDADDCWEINFLESMKNLIEKFPQGGMYNCSYRIKEKNKIYVHQPKIKEGVVNDYFKKALYWNLSWTSATVLNKKVFDVAGYFPVGMIGGEDAYMWTKVAIHFPVVFTPKILAVYNKNEVFSRAGKRDSCTESWYDLISGSDVYRNKYIASKAISKGIRYAWGGYLEESRQIEKAYKEMKQDNFIDIKWYKLFLLNRMPHVVRNLLYKYKKGVLLKE
jgi:glycosyltransferase involved in cell wall biosynthesis